MKTKFFIPKETPIFRCHAVIGIDYLYSSPANYVENQLNMLENMVSSESDYVTKYAWFFYAHEFYQVDRLSYIRLPHSSTWECRNVYGFFTLSRNIIRIAPYSHTPIYIPSPGP